MAETINEPKPVNMIKGLEKLIDDLTDVRRDIMIYSLKMEELIAGVNPIFRTAQLICFNTLHSEGVI